MYPTKHVKNKGLKAVAACKDAEAKVQSIWIARAEKMHDLNMAPLQLSQQAVSLFIEK